VPSFLFSFFWKAASSTGKLSTGPSSIAQGFQEYYCHSLYKKLLFLSP
jgi:hypothetical protein